MKLTPEEINSIAEDLETGMRVYVNIETKVVKTIPDFEDEMFFDQGPWKEDIKEIEENPDNFVEFEKMDTNEVFAVMEEFVDTVDNLELQKKLELGLSLSKPFRNFKDIIDGAGVYKNKWFEFKHSSYVDWVQTQLNHFNRKVKE